MCEPICAPIFFDPWDIIIFLWIPFHHNRRAPSYFLILSHALLHRFRSSSPNSAGGCFRPPITISPPLEEPSPRCQCLSGRAAEWGTRPSLSPRITPLPWGSGYRVGTPAGSWDPGSPQERLWWGGPCRPHGPPASLSVRCFALYVSELISSLASTFLHSEGVHV